LSGLQGANGTLPLRKISKSDLFSPGCSWLPPAPRSSSFFPARHTLLGLRLKSFSNSILRSYMSLPFCQSVALTLAPLFFLTVVPVTVVVGLLAFQIFYFPPCSRPSPSRPPSASALPRLERVGLRNVVTLDRSLPSSAIFSSCASFPSVLGEKSWPSAHFGDYLERN